MTEILFYHMTQSTLERTLPGLLERSIERGWRAVVQTPLNERCEALDNHLWTYRDDSFLPHGAQGEAANPVDHPIWITTGDDNPNSANISFLIDGAESGSLDEYERIITLFDGHDADAVDAARASWKRLKEQGHQLTYWQQNEGGGWEKKA